MSICNGIAQKQKYLSCLAVVVVVLIYSLFFTPKVLIVIDIRLFRKDIITLNLWGIILYNH